MRRRSRFTRVASRSTMVVVVSALMLAYLAMPAQAVHNLKMQLDGNTSVETGTTTPLYDWESFFCASVASGISCPVQSGQVAGDGSLIPGAVPLSNGFSAAGFTADYKLPDKTTFATGSKDTLNINPGWQCAKSNNVGDKVDIVNAYSAAYVTPDTTHLVLYFGLERASNNGDANIGVWFLHDGNVACDSSGGTTTFSGTHMDGDILLVSAFTNGGGTPTVSAFRWDGGASGSLNTTAFATGAMCPDPTAPDPSTGGACAITNSGSISPPWNHPDKTGGALDPVEFFEGGIDLGPVADVGCFARFIADTRSSQSPTATIFDYAEGKLSVCAPSTSLAAAITNPASGNVVHYGDSVTIRFSETNDGNSPLTLTFTGRTPLTKFVTTDTAACTSALTYISGDGNNNGKLDPGETWIYDCTFNAPNSGNGLTVTGYGNGYDLLGENVTTSATCTNTAVQLCDPDETASVTFVLINPSTSLTVTASAVVTYTYRETNDGNDTLSPAGVSDPTCVAHGGTVTYISGDDGNNKLDPGETWVFQCAIILTGSPATDVTNTATGTGTDSKGEIVTFCPTIGVTPANTLCDNQEVDSTRVLVDNITARPVPTASPSPSP